jgi:hypothetical protein
MKPGQRATSVPLRSVRAIAVRLLERLDLSAQRVRDRPARSGRLVLVDQRRASAIVAHPVHQVAQARAGRGGQRVPGMAQVVKMQTRQPKARIAACADVADALGRVGANGYGDGVEAGIFDSRPGRVVKADVAVMLERVRDELPAIQELWPRFERLVGLRGRRMYAMVTEGTYAACTPVREDDDPARLGLDTAILPGGWYLQARIAGEPPGLYQRIGPAVDALEALASPGDPARPVVEYYRRHDVVELWVPVLANC